MDEFLVAIMSAAALLAYKIITYFLFDFQGKVYVRWGLFVLIVVWVLACLWKRRRDRMRLTRLGVDAENYFYYQKYTSFGNKFSYIFTYMIQDFIYEVRSRNKAYNFSKGMFRFDDSLGEYYIDCRLGWYAYFKNNVLKNRLSLHKLRIFSLGKCNQMLLTVFPEQEEVYKKVRAALQVKVNELPEGKKVKRGLINSVEGSSGLHSLIRKNLYQMEVSRKYMLDHRHVYNEAMKRQEKRKEDIREIKNLYIDLDKKD